MSVKRKESIGPDERAKIRRLRSTGASLEQIAAAWEVPLAEVEELLVQETSLRDGASEEIACLKDPEDLCCPLSHALMDDPVVAADGVTYERSWVEEALKRMPQKSPSTGAAISTTVLLPNQAVKSMIVSFKEVRLKAVLDMAPRLREPVLVSLLASVDEDTVHQLHGSLPADLPCRRVVKKELARRLASPVTEQRLKRLWSLIQGPADDERDAWAQAAACLLSAHMGRLTIDLNDLSSELLREATRYVDDQDAAVAFARDFFRCDLGISVGEHWPRKSTASIFLELARRLADNKSEERLQLLVRAYGIDDSHEAIQETLAKQLQHQISSQDLSDGFEQQGLLLKLALKEGEDLPENVLAKLTLEERHLGQPSPRQLMLLAQQLGSHDRCSDGARVAVFAARAFESSEQGMESERAFLQAFGLDHSNPDAAQGIAKAVASAHDRCKDLEDRCEELEAKSRTPPLQPPVLSVHWELSSYHFSNFQKNQGQRSEGFQLPCGIIAWMTLYPKGTSTSREGMAALFLRLDKPAMVEGTWHFGNSEQKSFDFDFSKNLIGLRFKVPKECGRHNFMPCSEVNGCITLRIFSLQPVNSNLSFF